MIEDTGSQDSAGLWNAPKISGLVKSSSLSVSRDQFRNGGKIIEPVAERTSSRPTESTMTRQADCTPRTPDSVRSRSTDDSTPWKPPSDSDAGERRQGEQHPQLPTRPQLQPLQHQQEQTGLQPRQAGGDEVVGQEQQRWSRTKPPRLPMLQQYKQKQDSPHVPGGEDLREPHRILGLHIEGALAGLLTAALAPLKASMSKLELGFSEQVQVVVQRQIDVLAPLEAIFRIRLEQQAERLIALEASVQKLANHLLSLTQRLETGMKADPTLEAPEADPTSATPQVDGACQQQQQKLGAAAQQKQPPCLQKVLQERDPRPVGQAAPEADAAKQVQNPIQDPPLAPPVYCAAGQWTESQHGVNGTIELSTPCSGLGHSLGSRPSSDCTRTRESTVSSDSHTRPRRRLRLHGDLKHKSAAGSMTQRWLADLDDEIDTASSLLDRIHPDARKCLLAFLRWWTALEEPPREGCLARLLRSSWFECFSSCVIVANCIIMIQETNWELQNYKSLKTHSFFYFAELAFLAFYLTEVTIKLVVHRFFFFVGEELVWNFLELFLVSSSCVEAVLFWSGSAAGGQTAFLRALRILKIAKVMRVFRLLRIFSQLRLMLSAVIGSFVQLFWSWVMLAFVYYVFALALVQNLSSFMSLEADELDEELVKSILQSYGSVERGMLSLLKSTTGGEDWEVSYFIFENSGVHNILIFIVFLLFFQICLVNILTAVFIERALKLARPDTATRAQERRTLEAELAFELQQICTMMDEDGSGKISKREFQQVMASHQMRSCLAVLGLDVRNAEQFFEMLLHEDISEEVDVASFVQACMRMRGGASTIDAHWMLLEVYRRFHEQETLLKGIIMQQQRGPQLLS